MKQVAIHHSADYDGIFCREIARKFLPDAELIGWDFSDKPLEQRDDWGTLYVMDLPLDKIFGRDFSKDTIAYGPNAFDHIVWIDHHKSSIESHPSTVAGYRIDGVAACRLAWQYFTLFHPTAGSFALPKKEDYIERRVCEPVAVRLAGEYDIWDHRGDGDLEFQFGLDATTTLDWEALLSETPVDLGRSFYVSDIIHAGASAMECYRKRDADVLRSRSFSINWEGLNFIALNTAKCNSNSFNAKDVPESGHDALMAFYYNGKGWNFSLYHANHRKDLDLSQIAVKYGGGGHRGACGFRTASIPF